MPKKAKTRRGAAKTKHHVKHLHFLRVAWFSALAIGLLFIQLLTGVGQVAAKEKEEDGKVLAYATNVSVSALHYHTNQSRGANGLAGLNLSSKLNSSAQGKAQDMINNNYWAHVSPAGVQPWYWFSWAGYSYAKAGENLAYGFDSSVQIENAWMNSSGHRANILGDFTDVGFGIANGGNYQGGQYTVVVAHYGKPTYVAPAPAPTPTATTTTPKKTTTATKPAQTKTETPKPVATTPKKQEEKPKETTTTVNEEAQPPAETQRVTNLDSLLNGDAAWAIYASLGLVGVTTIGFAGTHTQLVRRGWKESRHFILVHPALDAAVITAIIAMLLTSSAGFIK